jgi:glycosyltransferase 2 family protein
LWLILLAPVVVAGIHPRVIAAALRRLRKGETRIDLRYRDLLKLLGAYCLCWCLYGVGFYLASTAVSLTGSGAPAQGPIGLSHLPELIGVNALSWTVGFVSIITPAGLGVREGVAFSLLSKTFANPYPSLIPLVARVWVTIAELVSIGIAAAVKGKR